MEKNNEQSKPKRRYKKRTKKVTSTEAVLSGTTKEVKEIPMYDPYTGEPNPHYEELTGKPNPLLPPKRLTIDSVATESRKELFGLPIVHKKVQIEPSKDFLDVKTNTRFLVVFPSEFGIEPFQIKSITRPTLTINKKSFLCFKYERTDISESHIEFIDYLLDGIGINPKISGLMNKEFDLIIQTLNPNDDIVEEMFLDDCHITKINFSSLRYGDNSLMTTTISIQPKSFSLI